MQWRRQRRVTHVIGSSNHVLLLARYQDDPPGEEDEEEGLRSSHNFDRHRQDGYKPWRNANGGTNGYNGAGSRSHRDESAGSPSQPKTNFNEDEYMRIATPRQDMLFKKGYFSKKKLWAGNASTSATPSTTESQSASHSTAGRDGSETTEDQQLLDRDCGNGENPPVVEPRAQLGYGTFYDHASGYYYEYPVMLFGPAPVPAPVGPSVLAAVPCEPVPLRPIEWINPAFVHKLADQPYCMMNYQTGAESAAMVREEHETSEVPVENTNGTCNESGTGTGSASCSGSVVGEGDEQPAEAAASKENQTDSDLQAEEQVEELYMDEQYVEDQCMVNGMVDGPYLKPVLMQQPVHVSHVIPAVPQPYMYPGHYMFGPPLVNVNGVTIQGGPMIRTTNVAVMSAACAKRRKKKKRRKQRLAAGNTEDEEEGEYSSECDTGLSSSRLPWTDCSTSTTTTTTTTTTTSTRTLNPECKEFQLRSVVELNGTPVSAIPTSGDTPISAEGSATNQPMSTLSSETVPVDKANESCNGIAGDSQNGEDETISENSIQVVRLPKARSTPLEEQNDEAKRLMNCLAGKEEAPVNTEVTIEVLSSSNSMNNAPNDASNGNDREEMNGVKEEVALMNGDLEFESNNEDAALTSKTTSLHNDERTRSRSGTPKTVSVENTENGENHESLTNAKSSLPKRKYSVKGAKFTRESTPGPDLNDAAEAEPEKANDATQSLNNVSPNDYTKEDSTFEREKTENELPSNCMFDTVCNHLNNEDPIEVCNEDSGFESQTRHSEYPITEAVTQWLRRVNSPDVFITSTISDSESEDEEKVEEPPKNLQGNPMPALSANNRADNLGLSRATNYGEFARSGNNVKNLDQPDGTNGGSRKKKESKKRSGERRRVRHVDGKLDEVVSSSDSCGQRDDSVRKKTLAKDVGDICEFTEEDSVAGMRVASNSRIDSKRVNARRTKRQGGRSNRDPVNNNEKIKHADNENDNNEKETNEDTVNVKTFEKGEIVVSEDGKLLTTSGYETLWNNNATAVMPVTKSDTTTKEAARSKENRSNSVEEENASGILSLDSIEELDVLECWEAETIEPVITPKKIMQCRGVSCEGEAGEEDNTDLKVNVDYVQKYYRLARESASIEEDLSSKVTVDSVPNRSDDSRAGTTMERKNDASNIPIEEAFEAYESCYTGKSSFLIIDSKIFKSRTLYGQEGEGPIPCKAVCCNIQ
nr:serine-rich adhesin for platelets-like isoform X3 [Megalopta genalis]